MILGTVRSLELQGCTLDHSHRVIEQEATVLFWLMSHSHRRDQQRTQLFGGVPTDSRWWTVNTGNSLAVFYFFRNFSKIPTWCFQRVVVFTPMWVRNHLVLGNETHTVSSFVEPLLSFSWFCQFTLTSCKIPRLVPIPSITYLFQTYINVMS